MDVVISTLKKKDFKAARKFAFDGMHLNWYTTNKIELYFYSLYFWCLEISRATRAVGAYIDGEPVGLVLADIDGEPKLFRSVWYSLIVGFVSFIMATFYKDAAGTYDETNKKMLADYKKDNTPDGELNLFAVNTGIKGKGIGSMLLERLEKEAAGKLIYCYTDSGATYQFYLKRGFDTAGKSDIILEISRKKVPLTCFLFSKRLGGMLQK